MTRFIRKKFVQKILRIVHVQYVCEKFVVQLSSQLSWEGSSDVYRPSLIARRTCFEPSSHCLSATLAFFFTGVLCFILCVCVCVCVCYAMGRTA